MKKTGDKRPFWIEWAGKYWVGRECWGADLGKEREPCRRPEGEDGGGLASRRSQPRAAAECPECGGLGTKAEKQAPRGGSRRMGLRLPARS